jgi:Uma2 family endonuclease
MNRRCLIEVELRMVSLQTPHYGEIEVPFWVVDLESYRRWIHSGVLPEKLKVHFINGRVVIDITNESVSHNQIRLAVSVTLYGLIGPTDHDVFVMRGLTLVNEAAELACIPDAMFISAESLTSERVKFEEIRSKVFATDVVGSPDMVLEVISPSSVVKDTEWLMTQYHDAGVKEYWVIDSRAKQELTFTIYSRTATEFVPVRPVTGWLKSTVLGKSFKLSRLADRGSIARYRLETK